jgi:hypothetical protein
LVYFALQTYQARSGRKCLHNYSKHRPKMPFRRKETFWGGVLNTNHRKSNDCSKWLTALPRLFALFLRLEFARVLHVNSITLEKPWDEDFANNNDKNRQWPYTLGIVARQITTSNYIDICAQLFCRADVQWQLVIKKTKILE